MPSLFRCLFMNVCGCPRVLGLQMVGKDAAEIIQGMSLVVTMGGCKKDLDNTMAMHPTAAEEFMAMS
ncbi:MAG: hypothetical protein M1G31_30175 [Pseudanabaena sp. Salubria-1]|nr:hypothetical protein [Pseudanabaena sp. Salubria-1]